MARGVAYTTRFNPTANGDLHLGHVYMALFNRHAARESGGRFLIRFENNQVDTLYTFSPDAVIEYTQRQQEALDWLGIVADEYRLQSDMDLDFKVFLARHNWYIPEYRWPYDYALDPTKGTDYIEEPGGYLGDWFAYAPFLTYSRVVYDAVQGVTLVIRGDDLRSEFALYQYYRQQMGLKPITHYYLPRLTGPHDEPISKFFDATPILEYRKQGWKPDDIFELLAQSALVDPDQGWALGNVKPRPKISAAFKFQV